MNSSRRSLVRHGVALAAAGALAGSGVFAPSLARAQGGAGLPMPDVKALVFDTFGTVVDWRNGVARETERILKPMGYDLDWLAFAEAWRKEYGPSMEEIRSGRRPFVKLDILHRENLDRLRPRFKLEKLDESTLAELNLARAVDHEGSPSDDRIHRAKVPRARGRRRDRSIPRHGLRADLVKLGVERAAGQAEPEDHAAILREVVAGVVGRQSPASPGADRALFEKHLSPWIGRFFADLERAKAADFYRPVGMLGRAFMDIETEAFALASRAKCRGPRRFRMKKQPKATFGRRGSILAQLSQLGRRFWNFVGES
jgi:hypothetical protein